MKLLYSDASPYARMARVVVHFLALGDKIELQIVNPFENTPELITSNPLGKIPCLVFNDGCSIYDSEVIMRYLDKKFGRDQLFPKVVDWQFSADFSLLKGLVDSTVGLRQEQMREDEDTNVRSPFWTARFRTAINQTLSCIEVQKNYLFESLNINACTVALVCALDYIDFRHSEIKWKAENPNLAKWHSEAKQLECFVATKPN